MNQIGRLYGGSLYDLAAEEALTDVILEQLREIRALFRENPDYVSLLCEPSLPKQERLDLIETAFGNQAERYLVNFLKLMCERNILNEFSGCCEEYVHRYNQEHNIAEAVVISAVALTGSQQQMLKEKLEKISGKKISLSLKLDSSVVAGLRIEIDGKQFDGTVQGRMSQLSGKIKNVIV